MERNLWSRMYHLFRLAIPLAMIGLFIVTCDNGSSPTGPTVGALATIAITKSRIGDDGVVFENCKFDNGMLDIDTETSVTFLGLEVQNEQKQRDKVRELLDKRKEREEEKRKNNNN